jgi:hypothetical protein
MKIGLVGVVLLTLGLLPVSAQTDAPRAIVRVGSQTLTTADLEHVKTLLPFERFKTTPGKSRLIDALYLKFMVSKAQLEGSGMQRITSTDIDAYKERVASSFNLANLAARGYSLEAFTERALLVQRYLALGGTTASTNVLRGFLEQWGIPGVAPENPTSSAANRERAITQRGLGSDISPWAVDVRSMLLESPRRAEALASNIRSESTFIAAARQHSLVRRDLGGAYNELGVSRVTVESLEPELQIAVMNANKTGLLRVAAPFGRVWLLWLSRLPSSRTQGGMFDPDAFRATASLRFTVTGGSNITPLPNNPADFPVQWFESAFTPTEFTLARVGEERLDLTEYIVAELFQTLEISDPESITSSKPLFNTAIEQFAASWLEPRVIQQGLPYGGAGGEYGLETYLAGRVTISNAQLKTFYWQHRAEYRYQNNENRVQCVFTDAAYAAKWRAVVIFAPFPIWDGLVPYMNCDDEGSSDPLPLPKLSSATFTPIAGGYITGILKAQSEVYFVAVYGFHPALLIKPFLLVRGEVERTYRVAVAKKQLEGFRAVLYQRTNAENRFKAVMQELEQP